MPKKEGIEAVGLRLHRDAAHKLKIVAVQRRTTFSAIVQEALALWWSQQPESKTEGALFPGEVESSATTATPVATQGEHSPPKKEEKASPKATGSEAKVGSTKAPKKK